MYKSQVELMFFLFLFFFFYVFSAKWKRDLWKKMEREFLFFDAIFVIFALFGFCFATLTFNKLDQILNSDFTEQEIREFEQQWQVPVLRIANVTGRRLADGRSLDGRAGVMVGYFWKRMI